MPETLKYFVFIIAGALFSALLGGFFGVVVLLVSPEFADNLFGYSADGNITGYVFAVGMIWGLFIGAPFAAFACLLTILNKIVLHFFPRNTTPTDAV